MSHLLVVTRPELVTGFQLAGINPYGVEDVETAEKLIKDWLNAGEDGLIALDEELLEAINAGLLRQIEASDRLHCLAIPGGGPLKPFVSHRQRITAMIRRAIGFHITFKGEEEKTDAQP